MKLECEDYQMKEYFFSLTLSDSRMKFRERSGCLKTCRVASPSDEENMRALYECFHCTQIDTGPNHWISCSVYSKFISEKGLDIRQDACLMQYYRHIIKMRTGEEKWIQQSKRFKKVTVLTAWCAWGTSKDFSLAWTDKLTEREKYKEYRIYQSQGISLYVCPYVCLPML